MGYAQETGYTPTTIATIMEFFRLGINEQFGTSYTAETFVGSNFYKYYYAQAQRFQENEVKMSEIFLKLQDYFRTTNEAIQSPAVTNTGLIETLEAAGFIASVKPMIEADAGKVHVAVDLDDEDDNYAADKLTVCTILKNSTPAGVVTIGSESESIVLTNGQSFDFKFALPARVDVDLRLTIVLSENNQSLVKTPEEIKQDLMDNIEERYRLGKNFEPQKYYSLLDAPWAESVLLEWDTGGGFVSTVFDADFDDLYVILLENITLVES